MKPVLPNHTSAGETKKQAIKTTENLQNKNRANWDKSSQEKILRRKKKQNKKVLSTGLRTRMPML